METHYFLHFKRIFLPKYIDLYIISYEKKLKNDSLLLYFRLSSTLKMIPCQLYPCI